MSNYNLFFSPTGGTRKVAEAVAEGWGESFAPVDLLTGEDLPQLCADDVCLVAVPSYGGRVPEPVVETLQKLDGNGAGAVLIAVFGNRAIDDTLVELYDVLKSANFRCLAGLEAVAQHSLMPRYGAGRPDEKDRAELKEAARKIRSAMEQGTLTGEPKLPGSRPYRSYNGVPLKPVATSACIRCGICAAQCPVGAIPMENPRATDPKKCISCMHCVAVCPKNARKLNGLMRTVASLKMKKTCSDRKENRLYL